MTLQVEFVEYMPHEKQANILYVSETYQIAIHLCACGCGNETVTPLGKLHGWTYTNDDGLITLSPSIGNFSYPCRSHYYIRKNEIIWV